MNLSPPSFRGPPGPSSPGAYASHGKPAVIPSATPAFDPRSVTPYCTAWRPINVIPTMWNAGVANQRHEYGGGDFFEMRVVSNVKSNPPKVVWWGRQVTIHAQGKGLHAARETYYECECVGGAQPSSGLGATPLPVHVPQGQAPKSGPKPGPVACWEFTTLVVGLFTAQKGEQFQGQADNAGHVRIVSGRLSGHTVPVSVCQPCAGAARPQTQAPMHAPSIPPHLATPPPHNAPFTQSPQTRAFHAAPPLPPLPPHVTPLGPSGTNVHQAGSRTYAPGGLGAAPEKIMSNQYTSETPGFTRPPRGARKGLGAQEVTRFEVTTDTDPLNIRAAADYASALLGSARRGSAVVLIGDRDVPGPTGPSKTGTWANVQNEDGLQGWAAQTGVDVHPTLTELAPGAQPSPLPSPGPAPAPGPTPAPSTTTGMNWTPWLIGGAIVLGGGVLGYALLVHPKSKAMRHAATAHEEEGKRLIAHAKRLREAAKHHAAREGAAKRKAKRLAA